MHTQREFSGEEMADLFGVIRQWAAERGVKNPAVIAEIMRHVADILERNAAKHDRYAATLSKR